MSGAEQQKAWTNVRLIRNGREVDRNKYQVLLEHPDE